MSRLFTGVAVCAAMLFSLAAFAEDDHLGVPLVPWSKKLDEGRYKSARDYEGTHKFFKDKYKGWRTIRFHREVSLPHVKYIHIQNTAKKRKWDGINIYAAPGEHANFYILPHVDKPAPPADKKPTPDADKK